LRSRMTAPPCAPRLRQREEDAARQGAPGEPARWHFYRRGDDPQRVGERGDPRRRREVLQPHHGRPCDVEPRPHGGGGDCDLRLNALGGLPAEFGSFPGHPDMPDGHVRRGQEAYAESLAGLLPFGLAWPRDIESPLMLFVEGLAGVWGDVDARAADLLERES